MALTQIVVLAALQGLTFILPVGTAGHLAILTAITGWPEQPPQLILAIQLGVLLATLAYFAVDLWEMGTGIVRAAKGKRDPGARLASQLFVASIPAIGLAIAAERYVDPAWRSMMVMGWATIGYGVLLLALDRMSMTVKRVEHAGFGDTMVVAITQVLALIPGTSRAGVSMTMARLLGYERREAARLSFLLSIPMWIATIGVGAYHLFETSGIAVANNDLAAAGVSFIVGLLAIATLMGYLQRSSFTPFVIWRLLVGAAVVTLAYGWVTL